MAEINTMNDFTKMDACDQLAYSVSGSLTFGTQGYLDRKLGNSPCFVVTFLKGSAIEVANLVSLPIAAIETVVRGAIALFAAIAGSTNTTLLNSWSFSLSTFGHNLVKVALPMIIGAVCGILLMCGVLFINMCYGPCIDLTALFYFIYLLQR